MTDHKEPAAALDDADRLAFELWASDPVRSGKLPLDRWPTNGGYKDTRTYIAFYGWLAGRASLFPKASAVPEGWKLVPLEPTPEMLAHTDKTVPDMFSIGDEYRAMLAAAPSAPQAEEAPQQTREAKEQAQRERINARFANRAPSPATADFDLPAPNDDKPTAG